MAHAERYQLQEWLDIQMRTALRRGFRLVNKPDADTLLVQFTITDDDTSSALLNTFSTMYPSDKVFSALKPLFDGAEPYSVKVNLEGKIMDATTGELLMASADARAGGKALPGDSGDLDDAASAYAYWSQHLSYLLCLRQGRKDCLRPSPS